MSYTKNTWQSGDVVTSAKLNHMEDGIEAASQGGSSDFTTAELTVTDTNTINTGGIPIHGVVLDDEFYAEYGTFMPEYTTVSATDKVTLVLYKGLQKIYISAESLTSTSGNITGNIDDGFTITGDCSIVCVGWPDE